MDVSNLLMAIKCVVLVGTVTFGDFTMLFDTIRTTFRRATRNVSDDVVVSLLQKGRTMVNIWFRNIDMVFHVVSFSRSQCISTALV